LLVKNSLDCSIAGVSKDLWSDADFILRLFGCGGFGLLGCGSLGCGSLGCGSLRCGSLRCGFLGLSLFLSFLGLSLFLSFLGLSLFLSLSLRLFFGRRLICLAFCFSLFEALDLTN